MSFNTEMDGMKLQIWEENLPLAGISDTHSLEKNINEKFDIHRQWFDAAKGGEIAEIETLLQLGADVGWRDTEESTALHMASRNGHKEATELLLKHGAAIDAVNVELDSALHMAVLEGHQKLVQLLLDHGATVDLVNDEKNTALIVAAQRQHSEIFELLVNHGAAINWKGFFSATALHITAAHGNKELVALLLNKGAEVDGYVLFGTVLHKPSEDGHTEIVDMLLNHGAAINAKNTDSNTALHLAARNGHKELVNLLLKRGAAVDAEGYSSDTPLHMSARHGYKEIVDLLLDYSAAFDAKNCKSDTAFHLAAKSGHRQLLSHMIDRCKCIDQKFKEGKSLLAEFSEIGDMETVATLLKNGADIETHDTNGQSSLLLAAKACQLDMVSFLISEGANIEATDNDLLTALHWSAKRGYFLVIELLLKNNANIDSVTKSGYTALHFAVECNHYKAVATLIQYNANIDVKTEKGFSPIIIALCEGHTDVLYHLKDAGARIGGSGDETSQLLHLASCAGQIDVAKRALTMIENENERIGYMNSSLRIASKWGEVDMVSYLLNSGADIEACDEDGLSPLFLAGEHPEVISTLIHYGAQTESRNKKRRNLGIIHRYAWLGQVDGLRLWLNCGGNVHSTNDDKSTALHYAVSNGKREAVEALLQHGIDINAKNDQGETALHVAIEGNFFGLANMLIDFDIDVEAKTYIFESTALHVAIEKANLEMVLLLLERQADVNAEKMGATALHIAVSENLMEICTLLIQHGANINSRNSYNETPLHLAISCRYPELVNLLLYNGASIHGPLPRRDDSQLHYNSILSYAIHHFSNEEGYNLERNLVSVLRSLIKAGADPTGLEHNKIEQIESRFPALRDILNISSYQHLQEEEKKQLSMLSEVEVEDVRKAARSDDDLNEWKENCTTEHKSNLGNDGQLLHIKHKYGYGFPPFKNLQLDNLPNMDDSSGVVGTDLVVKPINLSDNKSMDEHAVAIMQSLFDYFDANLCISGNFYILELNRFVNERTPKWASFFDKMNGIIREPGRLIVQFSSKKTPFSVSAWEENSHKSIRFVDAIYVCRRSSTQPGQEVFSDILGVAEKRLAKDVHAILIAGLSILSIAGGDELVEKLIQAILGYKLDIFQSVQTKDTFKSWQIRDRRQCPCNQTTIHRPLSPVAAAKAVGMSIWRERREYIVTRVWDLHLDQLVKYIDAREVVFITHRWSEYEVDYHIVMEKERRNVQAIRISELSKKLLRIRETLREHTQYVWIDTICIDKSNLSELDEAIRSMYKWYASCASVVLEPGTTLEEWHRRGWCLQEGAAAGFLCGISKDGTLATIQKLATEQNHDLCTLDLHLYYRPGNASEILARMDVRETTREEDMAYALAGVFSIHLTLAYGEGIKSRERLFHELAIQKGDLSFLSFLTTGSNLYNYLPAFGETNYTIAKCTTASSPIMISHFGACFEAQLVKGSDVKEVLLKLDRWRKMNFAKGRFVGVEELLAAEKRSAHPTSSSRELAIVRHIRSLILVEPYDQDLQTGGGDPIQLCYRLQCCQIEENEFKRMFTKTNIKPQRIWLGNQPEEYEID